MNAKREPDLTIPDGPPPPLDHERLEVYHVARALTRAIAAVMRKVPRGQGHADSLDDLRRAVKSVTHNITEASGEYAPADKAKFCRYARRSASECAGSVDHLVDFDLISEEDTWEAKWLIHPRKSRRAKRRRPQDGAPPPVNLDHVRLPRPTCTSHVHVHPPVPVDPHHTPGPLHEPCVPVPPALLRPQ